MKPFVRGLGGLERGARSARCTDIPDETHLLVLRP
jgi:hypothetical protein